MKCPHGDPFCPCPDGALCHYEGHVPWPSPIGLTTEAAYRAQVSDALLAHYGADLPSRMKPALEEQLAAARLSGMPASDHADALAQSVGLSRLPTKAAA